MLKQIGASFNRFPIIIDGFCKLIDLEFKNNQEYNLDGLMDDSYQFGGVMRWAIDRILENKKDG